MNSEVVRVLVHRLRELLRLAEKQKAKLNEVAPVEELLRLQEKGMKYIEANQGEKRNPAEFVAEVRRLAAEEKRLKAKIKEIYSRDYFEDSRKWQETERKISEIRNELYILGFREEIKSGGFSR